jgi:hypothetical protein
MNPAPPVTRARVSSARMLISLVDASTRCQTLQLKCGPLSSPRRSGDTSGGRMALTVSIPGRLVPVASPHTSRPSVVAEA